MAALEASMADLERSRADFERKVLAVGAAVRQLQHDVVQADVPARRWRERSSGPNCANGGGCPATQASLFCVWY
jgi:hypothetical protein